MKGKNICSLFLTKSPLQVYSGTQPNTERSIKMELIAILVANILFLVLVAFAVRLDRRIARVQKRSRHDVGRLTERLLNVNRSVRALQGSVEALSPAAAADIDEHAELAERQFVQAIEEIMSYGAPKATETEAAK